MAEVSIHVDASELIEFSALLDQATRERHRLPAHLKEAATRLASGGFHEVIIERGSVACVLTPKARAVAAGLRVALRP